MSPLAAARAGLPISAALPPPLPPPLAVYKESVHEHFHKVNYSHMKQRRKMFPWKESDCALFDLGASRAHVRATGRLRARARLLPPPPSSSSSPPPTECGRLARSGHAGEHAAHH